MEGGRCGFYLLCNNSSLLQHKKNSKKVSLKNRLIICSMQCRGKKVVKHKTAVGNELIADWHIWVDRISAQKGQKTNWTRSTIFCFWEAQLAFNKHTSTNWAFTSTQTKDEKGSLNLQQASSSRQQSHLVLNVTSCWPVAVFASVQIRAQRWSCLGLPDISIYRWPKGLGKKTLKEFKHN